MVAKFTTTPPFQLKPAFHDQAAQQQCCSFLSPASGGLWAEFGSLRKQFTKRCNYRYTTTNCCYIDMQNLQMHQFFIAPLKMFFAAPLVWIDKPVMEYLNHGVIVCTLRGHVCVMRSLPSKTMRPTLYMVYSSRRSRPECQSRVQPVRA